MPLNSSIGASKANKDKQVPIYYGKYLNTWWVKCQSLFNNDNEILQPTLTVQHLKPFQHTILRFKTFISAMEAKLMQKKS
jgi:hypothetical protein